MNEEEVMAYSEVIVGYTKVCYWHWAAKTEENYEKRHWRLPTARQKLDKGTARIYGQPVDATLSFWNVALWKECIHPGRHFVRTTTYFMASIPQYGPCFLSPILRLEFWSDF